MRSLPQPRYSRWRTLHRIWRSLCNLVTTGYVSDSSAYAHHAGLDKSSKATRIRTSRVTHRPTSRPTVLNRLGTKVVGEVLRDEGILANVVEGEWASFNPIPQIDFVNVNNRSHVVFGR